MAKYHLTTGNRLFHEYLRDCESDHIELAEYEAEQELEARGEESGVPSPGSMGLMVRVMEKDSGHCVYAAYAKASGSRHEA